MKIQSILPRAFAVGTLALGLTTAGLAVPESSPLGTPEASAACSSFKRAKVTRKAEILNPVTYGELRNNTNVKQMLVMDREVTDTRSTARSYTGDWQLFKAVLTAQVSQTVTTEHSVRGNHQVRIEVNPHRTFGVTGYIRTWMVYSEVTERNTNCNYKTTNVQGEVATTDGIIWRASDIGGA